MITGNILVTVHGYYVMAVSTSPILCSGINESIATVDEKNLETSIDRTVYKPTCPTKYTIQVKSQTVDSQVMHIQPD